MSAEQAIGFEQELVSLIPHLRAFARNLCRRTDEAEDLAQDTVARALQKRETFTPGTNLKAWLFTIMRRQFYSEKRRSWRSLPLDQDVAERTLVANYSADDTLALNDVRQALAQLTPVRREALILVGAAGFSYDEAAVITHVAVGTVKSRVSRARTDLQAILSSGNYVRDGLPAKDAITRILGDVETPSGG